MTAAQQVGRAVVGVVQTIYMLLSVHPALCGIWGLLELATTASIRQTLWPVVVAVGGVWGCVGCIICQHCKIQSYMVHGAVY